MNSVLNPEAPEFYPNFMSIVQEGYLQTNKTIRASNKFPIGTSYELFKTFTDFNVVTCRIRENVVLQSNQIMVKELPSVKLRCSSDDESNTEKIIDANDSFLDRININIDTLSGVNQPSEAFLRGVQPAAWNRTPVVATIKVKSGSATLIGAKNIPRPQMSFKDPVDNSDNIFKPKIQEKPNNMKPLAFTLLYDDDGKPVGYEHPYLTELMMYSPPEEALELGPEPTFPRELEDTPLTLVATEAQLDELVRHLDLVSEIAVDLEHHSYRTYQGITCLIQISTDEGGDFIVDALALRDHLHKLNQSFTDPKKIKVFHGADMDVQWLQRDFGVYVVGLFDTHQAAQMLHLGANSYKYLLQWYCEIEADKTHQLADWRMRPLPSELVRYARMDTHYLLYIWRRMRSALLVGDPAPPQMLAATFTNSANVCALTYKKPVVGSESHMSLYIRSGKRFSTAQLEALRLVYQWRDRLARELDEGTAYLLPNHMLLALAEALPREMQGLHAVCCPMPPALRQHLDTLHRIILSCRELPDSPALYRPSSHTTTVCPTTRAAPVAHDLPPDRRDRSEKSTDAASVRAAVSAAVSAAACAAADVRPFEAVPDDAPLPTLELRHLFSKMERRLKTDWHLFVPPYDRYRMYRIILQTQELKALKEKEAKVSAIGRGNELIREGVLVKIQKAHTHLERDHSTSDSHSQIEREKGPGPRDHSTPDNHSQIEKEKGPSAGTGQRDHSSPDNQSQIEKEKGPSAGTGQRDHSSPDNQSQIEKEKGPSAGPGPRDHSTPSLLKRKRTAKKKTAADQTADSNDSHHNIHKGTANGKASFYKNFNYKKFYSDNSNKHKKPKLG